MDVFLIDSLPFTGGVYTSVCKLNCSLLCGSAEYADKCKSSENFMWKSVFFLSFLDYFCGLGVWEAAGTSKCEDATTLTWGMIQKEKSPLSDFESERFIDSSLSSSICRLDPSFSLGAAGKYSGVIEENLAAVGVRGIYWEARFFELKEGTKGDLSGIISVCDFLSGLGRSKMSMLDFFLVKIGTSILSVEPASRILQRDFGDGEKCAPLPPSE